MTGTKFDIKKFDGTNDFALWQSEHIDEFHKLVGDLAAIDTAILDEDQALLLLTSLPSSYDNFKKTEVKGDGGEGLYVRRRSGQRDMEQGTYSAWSKSQGRSSRLRCYICQSKEHLKRDCPMYNHKKSQGFVRNEDQVSGSRADVYDNCDIRDLIRRVTCGYPWPVYWKELLPSQEDYLHVNGHRVLVMRDRMGTPTQYMICWFDMIGLNCMLACIQQDEIKVRKSG
ncbi:zinc finger, CCHC-type containing protein [Tanacetum coccineum]